MINIYKSQKTKLRDMIAIKSHTDFHDFLLCNALDKYKADRQTKGLALGSVMAVCANIREALAFQKYSFDQILLTGLTKPSDELVQEMEKDPRLSYRQENSECLRQSSASYDLVICKEGIHHLARPVLGVYEMLRVSSYAVIFIEPGSTLIGSFLEAIGKSSTYEKNQSGNMSFRDNYVYRWDIKSLKDLLKSYYLESGFTVDVTQGWLSSSVNCHSNRLVRLTAAFVGWLVGFTPGSKGNYFSAFILIGKDLPERVSPIK
jgi:hypothetical protein